MAPLNDDQAGEILARYVEALKSADDPATVNFVAITAAETDELAPVMKTAAHVAQALAAEQSRDAAKEATRRKFHERVAALARQAEAGRHPAAAPAVVAPWPVTGNWFRFPQLVGGLGWACALVLAVLLLVPRTAPPRTVAQLPLTHSEVHNSVPALLRNEVPVDHARLMWAHLVGCDACFSVYRREWKAFHGMAEFPPEVTHWREILRASHTSPAPAGR
jgi:hypothetical protein